jgi:bacterioferritin (cytochrome b1)
MWKKRLEHHAILLDAMKDDLAPRQEMIQQLRGEIAALREQTATSDTDVFEPMLQSAELEIAKLKAEVHRAFCFTVCVSWTFVAVPLVSAFLCC